METKMIKANPTREFFVNMLVRDILLKQAIIELIDKPLKLEHGRYLLKV